MEDLTASEIAGFGIGTMLLCATIAAPKVDALISASQRSSLGMCKKCGDIRMIACSQCKGVGLIRTRGSLGFSVVDDLFLSLGDGGKPTTSIACIKCQSKGKIQCPICS